MSFINGELSIYLLLAEGPGVARGKNVANKYVQINKAKSYFTIADGRKMKIRRELK